MKYRLISTAAVVCSCLCWGTLASANTTALDVALPYNYFVLGNFSATPDITGRIAIGGALTSGGLTVGSDIPNSSDPYSLAADSISLYAGSVTGGNSDNINKGNVYVAGASNANFNFNGGGTKLASCGSMCIDFSAAATSLKSYSSQLGTLSQTGTIGSDPGNPSRTLLKGTNSSLNVFNLTAAQFAGTLNIVTPVGSTTVVNVSGTTLSVPGGLYINGNQASGTQSAGAGILFNFPTATSLGISGQFSASILAPLANYNGTGQVDGNVIVGSVTSSGETHDALFTGKGNLPAAVTATPEPSTIVLLSGALVVIGGRRLRKQTIKKRLL